MKYHKLVNKGSTEFLDDIAKQEDKMFIRIFYNGKFVSYLFEPADVENLGLSNIFDMIDPDPDFIQAKVSWDNFNALPTPTQKKLAKPAKKKPAKLTAAR
jgi:hypothetical protein